MSFKQKIGEYIWWNGKKVKTEEAKIGLFTHSLHYGLGAFEGIRCYKTTDNRLAVFRLPEHIQRLIDSCKIAHMNVPYSKQELVDACVEVVKNSGIASGCYLRPLVFIGEGPLGLYPGKNPPIEVAIMAWEWGSYLGNDAKDAGAKIKISSYSRGHVNSTMTKAKLSGQYVNSILARIEAVENGCDEALLLDTDGYVSEGSGENIFIYRKGVLKTTPLTSVLEGITRDSILQIAKDFGIEVVEERFTRDELYCADEVFFTGTAAEITPIQEIDHREIGKPGPITKKISQKFFDVVQGKDSKYSKWLTHC